MQSNEKMNLSRRTFLGAAAGVAACSLVPGRAWGAAAARPDSKFGGVQIGVITYSYRSLPGSAEETLKYVTECGISSIELMGNTAEQFAKTFASEKADLVAADPMAGFKALRKLYNDAGVGIHIVKFGSIGNAGMPDEQIDYYFQVAKALGAKGITREISEEAAARLGAFADKHQVLLGFHNHMQLTPTLYDGPILSHGKYLAINLDIGHYVAGTNECPITLIEKYRGRLLSLHLKDRKKDKGPNMPFGEGDTPVAAALQYLKKNKLDIPCDIELEYKIPEGSDAVKEVTKCVQFCKQALS